MEKKSTNVSIFMPDFDLLQAEFDKQKATSEKLGVAAFGKQAFLGKVLKEALPFIQEIIFENKKLITNDKDIS